jgi:hypothetical protein
MYCYIVSLTFLLIAVLPSPRMFRGLEIIFAKFEVLLHRSSRCSVAQLVLRLSLYDSGSEFDTLELGTPKRFLPHCKDKMPKIWNKCSQERNIRASVPVSTFMYLWANYMYIPMMGLPFLLVEICGPILGIYKSLTDTWMLKLGLRPRYSQKRNI